MLYRRLLCVADIDIVLQLLLLLLVDDIGGEGGDNDDDIVVDDCVLLFVLFTSFVGDILYCLVIKQLVVGDCVISVFLRLRLSSSDKDPDNAMCD